MYHDRDRARSSPRAMARRASRRRPRAGSSRRARPARSSICSSCSRIPTSQPAQVTVDYLLLGGDDVTRRATSSPPTAASPSGWTTSRFRRGAAVRPLDNVAVSSTITSTNGVPIIVERTMWWPSPALTASYWTEAHNSPGATRRRRAGRWRRAKWAGRKRAETYILIANTSAFAGAARVTLYFEDGDVGRTDLRAAAAQPHQRGGVGRVPSGRGSAVRRDDREPWRDAGADRGRAGDVHEPRRRRPGPREPTRWPRPCPDQGRHPRRCHESPANSDLSNDHSGCGRRPRFARRRPGIAFGALRLRRSLSVLEGPRKQPKA